MQCPSCLESQKPVLHPPASTQDTPVLFEVVVTDIFEFEHDGKKHKMVLWRDRASSYVITKHLQEYTGNWEPTAGDIINSFFEMDDDQPKSHLDHQRLWCPILLHEQWHWAVDSSCGSSLVDECRGRGNQNFEECCGTSSSRRTFPHRGQCLCPCCSWQQPHHWAFWILSLPVSQRWRYTTRSFAVRS